MKGLTRRIDRYGRNMRGGRDLIVGDIHGHFGRLASALQVIGFNNCRDRLFSVGDLVDRGPHSEQALEWLRLPWFKAVRGNHEEAAIAWSHGKIDPGHYLTGFGAGWNMGQSRKFNLALATEFEKLPLAIELETERGLVVIVHAACPATSWAEVKRVLDEPELPGPMTKADAWAALMTWNHANKRERWLDGPVADVRAVVVGHTEKERITTWDNTHFIDTGGWNQGHFTLLDAATLLPTDRPGRRLDWSGA